MTLWTPWIFPGIIEAGKYLSRRCTFRATRVICFLLPCLFEPGGQLGFIEARYAALTCYPTTTHVNWIRASSRIEATGTASYSPDPLCMDVGNVEGCPAGMLDSTGDLPRNAYEKRP